MKSTFLKFHISLSNRNSYPFFLHISNVERNVNYRSSKFLDLPGREISQSVGKLSKVIIGLTLSQSELQDISQWMIKFG
jgi:tetrahydromethanopterin S-methyltransferase subunit G